MEFFKLLSNFNCCLTIFILEIGNKNCTAFHEKVLCCTEEVKELKSKKWKAMYICGIATKTNKLVTLIKKKL